KVKYPACQDLLRNPAISELRQYRRLERESKIEGASVRLAVRSPMSSSAILRGQHPPPANGRRNRCQSQEGTDSEYSAGTDQRSSIRSEDPSLSCNRRGRFLCCHGDGQVARQE